MVEMTALEDSKFVFPLYKSDATECPSTLDWNRLTAPNADEQVEVMVR